MTGQMATSLDCSYAAETGRICQTPDCLEVENVHSEAGLVKSIGILDTRLHLYVFVPKTTTEFDLEIFDQNDDGAASVPSRFELFGPEGTLSRTLDAPRSGNWTSYHVETKGNWGIWRLSVTGPQDVKAEKGQKNEKARNTFLVRTRGQVDLYLKPEPVARVRGLRLSEPHFGGQNTHRFTLQNLDTRRLRFNVLRDDAKEVSRLQLDGRAKENRFALHHDDRLKAGSTLETIELDTVKAPALLPFRLDNVRGVYGLGIENEARLFFNGTPLMKLEPVEISTQDGQGHPVAARIEFSSPQTANEMCVLFTGSTGRSVFWALPGVEYRANATRGFASKPQSATFSSTSARKGFKLTLPDALPTWSGWYGGDSHCHTSYYDGTHTPAQMVEAAQSAGLDWLVVSEHGHSQSLVRTERANQEAVAANAGPNFLVIPGMEYTGPQFHANILGGIVPVESGATLGRVLDAVRTADTVRQPLVCQLNHPSLGASAADIARATPALSLVELWNSAEPAATQLWFELLNRGQKVWAETGSDSHHRIYREVGLNRTYVFLGSEKLSASAVVRALREGRSVLSRGATLDFSVDEARSGETLRPTLPTVRVKIEAHCLQPLESIEIVSRGEVVHRFDAQGKNHFAAEVELPAQNTWMLARVLARDEKLPLALSNPVWIVPQDNESNHVSRP